jgi:membrane protein
MHPVSLRSTNRDADPALRGRLAAVRARFAGSWAGEIAGQLRALDFVNWITILGAALLWSALPLVILLSSLANETIDDDLSRHIGLNREGAHIVRTLFRGTPEHAIEPIATGFVFSFAGVIAVVSSMQAMYERVFRLEPRGRRNLPRWIAWTGVLLALLVLDGAISGPVKHAAGGVGMDLTGLALTTLFFWWTLHFLLAGRVPWRVLVRPAVATALLWFALALFSSVYFSPILISDSRTYGTIGVVFTLLTWFFLIGAVIVLGVVLGAWWQAHARPRDGDHRAPG